jgi:hypothetical protein
MTWPGGAAAACAVLALAYSGAAVLSPVDNDRTIPALEAELRPLARVLPRSGRIGYLEHSTRRADADVGRTFYVAQYTLAPRVLVPNLEPRFVIVIRDHAAPGDPRLNGHRLFAEVPGGHRVFVRTAP